MWSTRSCPPLERPLSQYLKCISSVRTRQSWAKTFMSWSTSRYNVKRRIDTNSDLLDHSKNQSKCKDVLSLTLSRIANILLTRNWVYACNLSIKFDSLALHTDLIRRKRGRGLYGERTAAFGGLVCGRLSDRPHITLFAESSVSGCKFTRHSSRPDKGHL